MQSKLILCFVLAMFAVVFMTCNADAAAYKYRMRKQICQIEDNCPTAGGGSSSGGGGGDITPPTVLGFSPADGAADVWSMANLVLTFSEVAAKGASGDITIRKSLDDSIVETISVAGSGVVVDGTRVTINPAGDLVAGNDYYVNIAPGAFEDASGNPFAGISDDSTWNFSVPATWPVAIQSLPAAQSLATFESGGNAYVLMGRWQTGPDTWRLYKFDVAIEQLVELQQETIPSCNETSIWEVFEHGGATYGLLSIHGWPGVDVNDRLYKFDPGTEQMVLVQQISNGSINKEWTSFVVDGVVYAHSSDYCTVGGCMAWVNWTKLWQFDPSMNAGEGGFNLKQTLVSDNGAIMLKAFHGGGKTYLAICRHTTLSDTLHLFDEVTGTFGASIQTLSPMYASFSVMYVDGKTYLAAEESSLMLYLYDAALNSGQGGLELVQNLAWARGGRGDFFMDGVKTMYIHNTGIYEYDPSLNGGKGGLALAMAFSGGNPPIYSIMKTFVANGKTYFLAGIGPTSSDYSYLYRYN